MESPREVLEKLVLSPLLNSIWQHITYQFKADDNIRDLESATRNLLDKKNDLMEEVQRVERTGQKRTRQFEGWLEYVDATKKEADEVVEKYKRRRFSYLKYSHGKTAAKTLLDVNRLLNDGTTQEMVKTPVPPSVQEMPVFTTLTSTPYVDPNLGRVLRDLRENDRVGMIGVWGMGGLGKTRFLKQINNSFLRDCPFDHVIWITLSRPCPIAKVQTQIVKSLKLQEDEDVPAQATIIFNFLKEKYFLLLLDDLCERIDLEAVGIPLPLGVVDGCKRKAVLTARSSAVCGLMRVGMSIKLEHLKYDDAFNLFSEIVGEETINSHPSIQSLARDLVGELAGLPSALITTGGVMNQKKKPNEWKNAIERVKKSPLHELGESDDMRDLKKAIQNLLAKKKDLMDKVDIAERNGQVQTHQFQTWLKEVDDTKKEADEVVDKYKRKEFWPDYNFGKVAAKTILDVKRLLNDGRTQEMVKTPVPPAVQEMPVSTTLTSIPYVDPTLERVLGYIREEDKAGMIGVWGMGGAGKTRLLRQINNSFIGDSSFDHVIWITVSRSCPIAKVQKQIVESLAIQKGTDENSQSNIIFNFLNKRSFLLLLDDLWERIDLQKVGIPPLGVINGCKRKAVLTTRSRDVCGQMEVRKPIKLECLKYDDAFNLFVEKVGEETINSHPSIQNLAENMVTELAGLPLALITIGRAMSQKKKPREWEHAIKQVKKSQLHELEHSRANNSEGLFHSLKISYDSLESDTLRECFLSCSMWPEDERIFKNDLIRCWMGLGLIKDFDNMSDVYDSGYSLVGKLMAACLLEDNDETSMLVGVHDLLRDMALWIVRDKWVVVEYEVPRDKEIWHTAERISIMNTEMKKLPPVAADYRSKLTTLMLQSNIYLEELGDLRAFVALTYLDLSRCGFDKFPVEVCGLIQLQYLNLTENYDIPSLPVELGYLVNLKFLILRDTNIQKIPKGVIAKLQYLQVLDLFKGVQTDDEILTDLFFDELECLNDLKGLGICVQGIRQLHRLIELANMSIWCLGISRLNDSPSFSLPANFLGDEQIQKNLANLRITNSNLAQLVIEGNSRQNSTWQLRALEVLYVDKMSRLEEIIWEGVVPRELFQALTFLCVRSCDKLKNISWILNLPCLNQLRVFECSSMRVLIATKVDNGSNPTFPCLVDIRLDTLPELVSICNSAFAFPSLRYVNAWKCPKLKKLPFQTENIPSKLQLIRGGKEWFDGLEWEESSVKTRLHNMFIVDKRDEESYDSDDAMVSVLKSIHMRVASIYVSANSSFQEYEMSPPARATMQKIITSSIKTIRLIVKSYRLPPVEDEDEEEEEDDEEDEEEEEEDDEEESYDSVDTTVSTLKNIHMRLTSIYISADYSFREYEMSPLAKATLQKIITSSIEIIRLIDQVLSVASCSIGGG